MIDPLRLVAWLALTIARQDAAVHGRELAYDFPTAHAGVEPGVDETRLSVTWQPAWWGRKGWWTWTGPPGPSAVAYGAIDPALKKCGFGYGRYWVRGGDLLESGFSVTLPYWFIHLCLGPPAVPPAPLEPSK